MLLAGRIVAVDESDVSFMVVVAMLVDIVDTLSVLTTSVAVSYTHLTLPTILRV